MNIANQKLLVFWRICLMVFTTSLFAQGMGNGLSSVCREDRMTFCSESMGDHAKMLKCMNEHDKALSKACREHKNAMNADMKSAHAACMADLENFCNNVKPGRGRMRACLKQHLSELSQVCKDAHKNLK